MRRTGLEYLWYYLWIAPHVLQLAVGGFMLRRRLHREFPAFLAYIGYEVLLFTLLFGLARFGTSREYWYASMAGTAGSALLRFAVIREIFLHVLRPYQGLRVWSGVLFRWATVALILLAVGAAGYAPGNSAARIMSGVWVTDRAVSIVQCGLLLFLFIFSSWLSLSWRSCTFGIALGLGIFASVELAVAALRAEIGPAARHYLFDVLTMGTYHGCVLIWLYYVAVPEPEPRALLTLPPTDVESWRHELQRLVQR
jgi:hypothetical protein